AGVDGDGEVEALASFDTAIEDGLVVEVGDEVDLNPVTGSITLPEEFVQALRDDDQTSIEGGGLTVVVVDETGEPLFVDLEFADTAVPVTGPMILEITGGSETFTPEDEGSHTLVAEAFFIGYGEDEETGGILECELTDEGDPTIDTFEAVAAATPPPTPTPTVTVTAAPAATPQRPVLVQTDFAGEGPSALPIALAGGALVLGAGVAASAGRRAGARRR
ncbi:MAG: DUF6801 domain-containing protein, partial [Dermatophilaceae bacterium]